MFYCVLFYSTVFTLLCSIAGLFAMITSLAVLGGLYYRGYSVEFVHQKWFPMLCAANLYSFLLSLGLYLKAEMCKDTVLAPTATGNFMQPLQSV